MRAVTVAVALAIAMSAAGALAQTAPQTAMAPDAKAFDSDTGYYQLAPRLVLRAWQEGGRYYVRLTRQPALEVFPSAPDAFFAKAVAAQLTFERDAKGAVVAVTLHQNGRDLRAPRMAEAAAEALEAAVTAPRTWPMLGASSPRVISEGPGIDEWPAFSPDGKTVLFARTTDGRTFALMTMSAEGGPAAPFLKSAPSLSADRPNWSARTGMVAFTAETGASASTWVANADGTGAHAVAASGLSDQMFYPSWYPDGQSLAAMDAAGLTLKRLPLKGGAAALLTDRAKVMTGMPNVSPDGAWVAFAGQASTGQAYEQTNNVIWLVGPGGVLKPLEARPAQARAPSWSPDGKRVAFESDRGSPDGRYALFVVGRDGTGLAQVTDYALNAGHPVWSPDGKRMVFDAQQGAGRRIAVVDLP